MDTQGASAYRGFFYRVSVHHSHDDERWLGTIDVCRTRLDGSVEDVISHLNVPGTFETDLLARESGDAYARLKIDQGPFQF